jgi:hypothetical protein
VLKTGIATVLRGTLNAQGPTMLRVQTKIRRREEGQCVGATIKQLQITKEAKGGRQQVRGGRNVLDAPTCESDQLHFERAKVSCADWRRLKSARFAQRCRAYTEDALKARGSVLLENKTNSLFAGERDLTDSGTHSASRIKGYAAYRTRLSASYPEPR